MADGTVEVLRGDQGKAEVSIGTLSAGDYFGELELIQRIPRYTRVVAKTEATLGYFNSDKFSRLFTPLFDEFRKY